MDEISKKRIFYIKECLKDGKVFRNMTINIPKRYRCTGKADGLHEFCKNNSEYFKDIVFKRRAE